MKSKAKILQSRKIKESPSAARLKVLRAPEISGKGQSRSARLSPANCRPPLSQGKKSPPAPAISDLQTAAAALRQEPKFDISKRSAPPPAPRESSPASAAAPAKGARKEAVVLSCRVSVQNRSRFVVRMKVKKLALYKANFM